MNRSLAVLLQAGVFLALVVTGADAQLPPSSGAGRLFVSVFLVRGSVAGSAAGGYGLFTQTLGDTVWTRATKSNVLAFGLGYFDNGLTRRYYLAAGNGVHRSTDGGKNWRILTSWRTEEILAVVPDPVDSAVIYAATPLGVFKTTDDGDTWERKMNGVSTWFIQRIVMDRRDRRTLYAATEKDLYRTTDAGETWSPMGSGCAPMLAVLQHPAMDSVIIVGGEDSGLRRTTDGGKTWSAVRGLEKATVYTFRASRDGSDLYTAGWKTGLWRSTDAGASWQQVWAPEGIDAVYSLFVYPEDARHILVGTVGHGIYESTDRGATWHYAGLNGGQVKQIELYP